MREVELGRGVTAVFSLFSEPEVISIYVWVWVTSYNPRYFIPSHIFLFDIMSNQLSTELLDM